MISTIKFVLLFFFAQCVFQGVKIFAAAAPRLTTPTSPRFEEVAFSLGLTFRVDVDSWKKQQGGREITGAQEHNEDALSAAGHARQRTISPRSRASLLEREYQNRPRGIINITRNNGTNVGATSVETRFIGPERIGGPQEEPQAQPQRSTNLTSSHTLAGEEPHQESALVQPADHVQPAKVLVTTSRTSSRTPSPAPTRSNNGTSGNDRGAEDDEDGAIFSGQIEMSDEAFLALLVPDFAWIGIDRLVIPDQNYGDIINAAPRNKARYRLVGEKDSSSKNPALVTAQLQQGHGAATTTQVQPEAEPADLLSAPNRKRTFYFETTNQNLEEYKSALQLCDEHSISYDASTIPSSPSRPPARPRNGSSAPLAVRQSRERCLLQQSLLEWKEPKLAYPRFYEMQKHRTSMNRTTNSLSMKSGICNADFG